MPDQTYAPVLVPPPNASQTLNTTEPDQVTGVPTSAAEIKKQADLTTETGGTGTTIVGGFLSNQDYNPDFTGTRRINLFDEMRLSDATVRAGLNMVKLPILSADWYIKDPSGESELGDTAEFINRQLFKNPNFTWTAFLRQALTMCDNGNAIFEKVFELLPDGKIGWKRFGPRMSKTIYRWTLSDGVSPGIYQILPTRKTAEIPRWKLLYFINEQEGSNYEGISLLRAAHKPWYYKNLYYKVDSIAVEKQGMGIVKVTHPPQASPQEIAKVEEIAKNVRANEKAYIKLPAGYNLEFIDTHANTLLPETMYPPGEHYCGDYRDDGFHLEVERDEDLWIYYYTNGEENIWHQYPDYDTEANARAKLLLYLLENGYIKLEELNTR